MTSAVLRSAQAGAILTALGLSAGLTRGVIGTYVKSATSSRFGAETRHCRPTRSGARAAADSVRWCAARRRARVTPRQPLCRMTRSTVGCATGMPWRCRWRPHLQAAGAGYTAFVVDAYAGVIPGWECSLVKDTGFVERALRHAVALPDLRGPPARRRNPSFRCRKSVHRNTLRRDADAGRADPVGRDRRRRAR